MFDKRLNIFVGNYGSGKSAIAVNYALGFAQKGEKTAIVDMDIVNPYFRSSDVKEDLEKAGVRVISTLYANTNVDIPALPAEINTLFEDKSYKVVFDVGGDDAGAVVLGRYRDKIIKDDFEIFFVINLYRPMTNTVDKIIDMIGEIEASANLKITGLVNNTNLLEQSTAKDLIESQKIINKVSNKLMVPIKFISTILPKNEILNLKFPLLPLRVLLCPKYLLDKSRAI